MLPHFARSLLYASEAMPAPLHLKWTYWQQWAQYIQFIPIPILHTPQGNFPNFATAPLPIPQTIPFVCPTLTLRRLHFKAPFSLSFYTIQAIRYHYKVVSIQELPKQATSALSGRCFKGHDEKQGTQNKLRWTPTFITNILQVVLSILAALLFFLYITAFISQSSIPSFPIAHRTTSHGTRWKAFSLSKKAKQKYFCLTKHLSCNCRAVKMASMFLFRAWIQSVWHQHQPLFSFLARRFLQIRSLRVAIFNSLSVALVTSLVASTLFLKWLTISLMFQSAAISSSVMTQLKS